MSRIESIFIIASAILVGVYHFYLYVTVRRSPEKTAIGMTNLMRQQWVQTIMGERRDILAVQTIRNWVMASSFLASTAILVALGVLNAAIRPNSFLDVSNAINIVGTTNETLWIIKLMILVVDFFLAFFNFTLAIRYFNQDACDHPFAGI